MRGNSSAAVECGTRCNCERRSGYSSKRIAPRPNLSYFDSKLLFELINKLSLNRNRCHPHEGSRAQRIVTSRGITMEQIAVNLEVHFHEQEIVSIFHETNVTGLDEQFAELVFAGAFAIRSMSNLGPHEVTDALGQQLLLLGRLI